MLTLYLKDKEYNFPNSWEELNADQFIYLARLLRMYHLGLMKAGEVQVMFFLKLAGLMPRRFRNKEKQELFSENVYRAAIMINFYFRYIYKNAAAFNKLKSELKEQLLRTDPMDLPETTQIRGVRKLERYLEVDGVFAANLIPVLPGTGFYGYQLQLNGEFLDTNLTAAQYVDAYSVFQQWAEKNDQESLDLLCAILYQDKKRPPESRAPEYSEDRSYKLLPEMKHLNPDVKYAVMFNFMAIHLYFAQRTKYSILFSNSGTDKKGKLSLGFHDSIYSLAKTGYGEVESFNLVKFLDLMLKELIDSVKSMNAMDISVDEIAKNAGLSIAQIKTLI